MAPGLPSANSRQDWLKCASLFRARRQRPFPLNTKASSTVQPLHARWHPGVSVFLDTHFGIFGMERLPVGRHWRWVSAGS